MRPLDKKQVQDKRAEAQTLDVTLHVGKGGVTEATVTELAAQLKRRKLVKVRLLPAATEGGAQDEGQADALAKATGAQLIEVRGHTAVFWKGS